ncbi:MAG: Brp/Blh family beta-carotene 15,15'-dioxygenase [Nonlabens sp.]
MTIDYFEFNSIIIVVINALLIMTIGLLHGSNDLVIYQKLTGTKWRVLALYYAIVTSLFLVLYFIHPLLSLIAFVLVSAFHFGEEMNALDDFKNSILHCLLSGLVVFFMMFYFNYKEFNSVIYDLSTFQVSQNAMLIILILTLLIYLSFFLKSIFINKIQRIKYLSQWIGMAFLASAFYLTDLLTSFTLFFVFWHSLPSVRNQTSHIYKSESQLREYVKDALPIYLISVIGIVIGFYLFCDERMFSTFALFAAIIVTVPHIIIIYRLYRESRMT